MVSMLQKLIYFSGFLKEDKYMVRVRWGEGIRLQSKTLMPAAVAVAVVRFCCLLSKDTTSITVFSSGYYRKVNMELLLCPTSFPQLESPSLKLSQCHRRLKHLFINSVLHNFYQSTCTSELSKIAIQDTDWLSGAVPPLKQWKSHIIFFYNGDSVKRDYREGKSIAIFCWKTNN